MNKEDAHKILVLLNRVTLQGNEAQEFLRLQKILAAIIESEEAKKDSGNQES